MVRFFFAIRPFPAYALAGLLGVTVFGMISISWSPEELDSALGLLLFVQMFLASSGFVTTAHRGHFDPVLGYGTSRMRALAAQWAVSILPGLIAWGLLVATAFFAGSRGAVSALAGTRLAAFFIVSAVAWSAGYALPRSAAGVVWTGVLMWLLLRHPDLLAWAGTQASPAGIVRTALVLAVCPFLLVGHAPIMAPPVAAAAGAALVALLVTWRIGARLDVYLVERS